MTRFDSNGASSRYRSYQYGPYFEQAGFEVIFQPLFDGVYLKNKNERKFNFFRVSVCYIRRIIFLLLHLRASDKVIVEKEILPYCEWIALLALYIKCPAKIFYDFDDAVWHHYERRLGGWLGKIYIRNFFFLVLKRKASKVFCGSNYLKSYIGKNFPGRIVMIPTSVPQLKYDKFIVSRASDSFALVWIGSQSTSFHLRLLFPIFESLYNEFGIKCIAIGYTHDASPLPEFIDQRSWSSESEVLFLKEGNLGIMPIPATDFALGKCGFKLIQYFACGLPALGSNYGENKYILEESDLCSNDNDWYEKILRFYRMPDHGTQRGEFYRMKFISKYSTEGNFKILEKEVSS